MSDWNRLLSLNKMFRHYWRVQCWCWKHHCYLCRRCPAVKVAAMLRRWYWSLADLRWGWRQKSLFLRYVYWGRLAHCLSGSLKSMTKLRQADKSVLIGRCQPRPAATCTVVVGWFGWWKRTTSRLNVLISIPKAAATAQKVIPLSSCPSARDNLRLGQITDFKSFFFFRIVRRCTFNMYSNFLLGQLSQCGGM